MRQLAAMRTCFLLVVAVWLLAVSPALAQAQTDDRCLDDFVQGTNCLSIVEEANWVTSIRSQVNSFQNPMLEFLVNQRSERRVYFPPFDDALYVFNPEPENAHCPLLLLGFAVDGTYQPWLDEAAPDARIGGYAFCTRNNLAGVASRGEWYPPENEPIFPADDQPNQAFSDRLSLVPDDVAARVVPLLNRAVENTCPNTDFGNPAPDGSTIGLTDYATQLAVFIAYDGLDSSFQRMFIDAGSAYYARDYDDIYCLLGVDDATLQSWQTRTEGFEVSDTQGTAPLEITLSMDTGNRHILDVELAVTDSSGRALVPDEAQQSGTRYQQTYTLSQPGEYTARVVARGAPFTEDDRTSRGYRLAEATTSQAITVVDSRISDTPWFMEPAPLLPFEVPLLYLLLGWIGGVSLLVTLISFISSRPRLRVWLRVGLLLLIVAIIVLIVVVQQGIL